MTNDNLDPAAYLRAMLGADELQTITEIEKAKTTYMQSERDEQVARHVKRLTVNAVLRRNPALPYAANNRAPGRGFCLVGPSGAGKSRLLEETFRDHAAFPNWAVKGKWCPLISIAAPSPSTLGQLGIRILEMLDYDLQRELKENNAWLRVRQQLRLNNVLFLWIDDLNNALHVSSEEEIQKIRDTLKDLMSNPEWPVQLVVSGIPELMPLFRHDRQLRRRFKFMYLNKLSPDEHAGFLQTSIEHYASEAKLKLGETIKNSDLADRLLHAGVYEMGITLEILSEAIEETLDRGANAVEMADFANAFAARNALPDEQNPFVNNAWHTIDTSRLQPKDVEEIDDTVTPLGRKRGKGKEKKS
jgi:hypothetical protein